MPRLSQYDFIFAIGTGFAMLDAYNNGANDVANSWATSVSSRSISYRMAMVLGAVFEMLGAITVGSRTADTIKNGIIPPSAFRGDAGVQMLAFTCALAAASSWVMWCTRHSAHVSSTYSLVSAVAGVGVAVAGASEVEWGWNGGKGMGAIFAGLAMAPVIAGGFGSVIFSLIKFVVHVRQNPVQWAVWTSPFWFFVAGTSCVLTIVYKGSPNLKLNNREGWWQAAIILGTGGAVCLLSALFFLPYVHAKVIKRDPTIKWYHAVYGPFLFSRPGVADADKITVPDYAVVQHDEQPTRSDAGPMTETKAQWTDSASGSDLAQELPMHPAEAAIPQTMVAEPQSYEEILAANQERFHAKLRQSKGPLGWAMRTLHENRIDQGAIHEIHNLKALVKRIPAMIVVGLMYGSHYDIHAAQTGIAGTPEGNRMEAVYSHAKKYSNEVEHTYSFVQVLTACTASFAHGANDVGNAVGPWAAIYSAWSTGDAQGTKAPVPIWQLAVMSGMISIGLVTYGFNIMKVMGNKITYHSPSRGCSMEMGAAITIVIFSQYSLPVSTSMCITGATVGVGLCNGTLRAVNWHRVGLLMISWLATIPIAGTLAGVITGIILNSPRFGLGA